MIDDDDIQIPEPHVLLVDDTPENLVALEAALEDVDCVLDMAGSGNEALARLLRQDYALVLLDVQMPVMDGFEVAELMRSNRRTAHVPIIFVTANSRDDRNIRQGYKSGAVDYLFKPVDPMMLRSKVAFFLQLDRQKRRLEAKLAKARESERLMNEAYNIKP